MKKTLLRTVKKLEKDNINLLETPVIYKWSYEEQPYVEFQLLIKKTPQSNLALDSKVH
jgi:3-polyprenyl-4-hydroxybenzoate decarboxylase